MHHPVKFSTDVLPKDDSHLIYKFYSRFQAYDLYLDVMAYINAPAPTSKPVTTPCLLGMSQEEWQDLDADHMVAINRFILHLVDNKLVTLEFEVAIAENFVWHVTAAQVAQTAVTSTQAGSSPKGS